MTRLRTFLEQNLRYSFLAQQLFFALTLKKNFPHSLNIETTNLCNLACIMCPRGKSNRPLGRMKFDLYKKIIDEIVLVKKKVWTLTLIKDGEPLLHPQLDEFIAYAAQKKVARSVEIFTNGILLDKHDWSRRLLVSGLDILNISLDAATAGTYQKIRGSNQFTRVVSNISKVMALKHQLNLKKPSVIIRAVGMKANQHELSQLRRMWTGKVDGFMVTPFSNYGAGIDDKLGIPQIEKAKIRRWPCLVLWYNPVVNWDGKVTTCCVNYLENELILGDVRRQTVRQIWQNPKYRQLRQDHLQKNFDKWPTCRKCSYWRKFADMGWWLCKK